MAIQYIGGSATASNVATLTISGHQAGDLIILSGAAGTGTGGAVLTPPGSIWVSIGWNNTTLQSYWYTFATNSNSISVPQTQWTPQIAVRSSFEIFRGVTSIGGSSLENAGFGTSYSFPPIALNVSDGSSVLYRALLTRDVVTTPVMPSGYTQRLVSGAKRSFTANTDPGVSSYPVLNVSGSSSTATTSAASIELMSTSGQVNSGKIKYSNGSSFVAKPVKVWDGNSWAEKPLKYWTGTEWRKTSY